MIVEQFYLTEEGVKFDMLIELTEMSRDEIEAVVGRFRAGHHAWPGQLKGEVLVYADGGVRVRHHFKKRVLWES